MKEIIQLLHEGEYSCVIANKNEIRTFSQHGVADLYQLINIDPTFLNGAFIADKIIGKAAAALLIKGGIRELYTDVISQSAITLLLETNIKMTYKHIVPYIENRVKTGWCPMEKMCYEENSVEGVFLLIDGFITQMKKLQID